MMKELFKTLKRLSWRRWEKSMIDIRKFDPEYEESMDRVIALEQRRENMEISPEDKKIIDSLRDAMDDVAESDVNLAYLAGVADCLLILDTLDLIEL